MARDTTDQRKMRQKQVLPPVLPPLGTIKEVNEPLTLDGLIEPILAAGVGTPEHWIYSHLIPSNHRLPDQVLLSLLDRSTAFLAEQPENQDALFIHARALTEYGKVDEAIATYELILAKKPDHTEALRCRANAKIIQGDFTGGLLAYEQAYGVCHKSQSEFLFLVDWSWALSTCPEQQLRTQNIELTSGFREPRPTLAIRLAEQAYRTDPYSPTARIALASSYANLGLFGRANELLEDFQSGLEEYSSLCTKLYAQFSAGRAYRQSSESAFQPGLTNTIELPQHAHVDPTIAAEGSIELTAATIGTCSPVRVIASLSELLKHCSEGPSPETRREFLSIFKGLQGSEFDWEAYQRVICTHQLEALRRIHDADFVAAETTGSVQKGEKVGLSFQSDFGKSGRFTAPVTTDQTRRINRVQFPPLELRFSPPEED